MLRLRSHETKTTPPSNPRMQAMNAIAITHHDQLPTASDPVPTLTSRDLHSRLTAGVAKMLVGQGTITRAELPALRSYRDEAYRLLIPATSEEIGLHLGKLALHYPQPDLSETASATRWNDWIEDFSTTPLDILAAACRDWRRSENRFFPSPGQLLALCVEARLRRSLAVRAEEVIELLEAA